MTRHTQGSLAIVGMIAGGVFLVAFVALQVMGDYDVSPAGFLAILVAAVARQLDAGDALPLPCEYVH